MFDDGPYSPLSPFDSSCKHAPKWPNPTKPGNIQQKVHARIGNAMILAEKN
jgi:hypothetical protein